MKNKLILFDWGGIVESQFTGYAGCDAWNDIFLACGYKKGRIDSNTLVKYRFSGIKTEEEFAKTYEMMANDFGLSASFSDYKKIYKETFDKVDYYKEVVEFEKSLKGKCYIGILSNLSIYDKDRIDKQVGLKDYDYVFLSFKYGYRKPEMEFYKIVQDELPFKASDILFLDDRLDNILSAKKMGWNAVQITGLELDKIKKICEEFIND